MICRQFNLNFYDLHDIAWLFYFFKIMFEMVTIIYYTVSLECFALAYNTDKALG